MKYDDEYDYMFDFTRNDYVFRNENYKKYCEIIFNLVKKREKYINSLLKEVYSMGNLYETKYMNNVVSKYGDFFLSEEDIKKMLGLNICKKKFLRDYNIVEIEDNIDLLFGKNSNSYNFINIYKYDQYLTFMFFVDKKNEEIGQSCIKFFLKKNKKDEYLLDIARTRKEFDKQYLYSKQKNIEFEKKQNREITFERSIRKKFNQFFKNCFINKLTVEEKEFIKELIEDRGEDYLFHLLNKEVEKLI